MDFSGIKPYSSESSTVQDTFYSLNDDCIVVRKFVASTLDDGRRSLVQYKAGTGEWVFLFKSYFDGNLALLVEDENDADESPASHSVSASDITVTIDGVEYVPAINHGYMLIAGPFDSGCVISLAGTHGRA